MGGGQPDTKIIAKVEEEKNANVEYIDNNGEKASLILGVVSVDEGNVTLIKGFEKNMDEELTNPL